MVMIDVDLDDERLRVRFTSTEALLGGLRDVDVPTGAVASVEPLPDPWCAVHGKRSGVGVRGISLLGCWHGPECRQLVALRRDLPAVRIRLHGCEHDELLLSTPHADLVVSRLRRGGVRPDLLLVGATKRPGHA
jgi:hypothetical protein